ncbi:MAG: hypothetical protein HGA90_00130 [Alphaproteobacteria bacterium]|nr:hypothetical protein [Alphaproteobacteria bacterium]
MRALMKVELGKALGKHVPLALVASLLIQGATIVWWASAKERDNFFLTQRVANVESGLARTSEGQGQLIERLARIEERVNAQLILLDRIEKQLDGARK